MAAISSTVLRELMEPAPFCFAAVSRSEAIELFQRSKCDRLVILDEQQMPIGVVSLQNLIDAKQVADQIEPVLCLSGDQLVLDCAEQLESTTDAYWIVVDRDDSYLGVVNTFYLKKFLQIAAPHKVKVSVGSSESLWHQVRTDTEEGLPQFRSHFQVQIQELRSHFQDRQVLSEDLSVARVRSLMQFLERLPLPLMLQTNLGEAILQNTAWSEQFGELVDPSWVQREAAAALEYAISGDETIDRLPLESPSFSNMMTRLCQVGSDPNSCICVCPLKNGQERIVQFVKVPLGMLLAGQDFEVAASRPAPFRLAHLESLKSVPRNQSSEDGLWLVIAQDVTEQQQLARELAAKNADLVQLNRLKDEFLACISHELRTPLTAVLGLSSLLKDQLSGSMSERQVRYANLIYRSGRHLMAIVNDILDLTRIETGQLELTLEPVSIATVCDRAFEQAQQIFLEEQKPTDRSEPLEAPHFPAFNLDVAPELRLLVADETRLRQILVHLLSNALKFTESTGRIGLQVSQWEGWIAFTVWDTGIGIPSEKQHLIFQKFQQLENPLTRRFEGAGLGLVLAQRLARLHGGDISFLSKENEGSHFTLLLPPTHPEPTMNLAAPLSSKLPIQNRLILVVEAVVRSLESLSEKLGELGYRVMIARSGTEAVEKARRLQPCAIFLNPLLPTLSGWDVLTLLKADSQTKEIPVVVMGTRGDREQAYRNHADGFLNLPILQKPLSQVLNQLTSDEPLTAPVTDAACSLVVLRLSPTRYNDQRRLGIEEEVDLNALLHSHNYRVVEADDLEQAELLAQVWKPNIVLLDPVTPDPAGYLKLLAEKTFLSSLPLVTLDLPTTQAANQTTGLTVFPCLAPLTAPAEVPALLQVIQVAAGFAWRPLVLAIDSAVLLGEKHPEVDWLQAVIQYLQTAGFRGMIARSRSEVMQKLEAQSVDLLLLHWHPTELNEAMQSVLAELQRLKGETAIVVIDQPASSHSGAEMLHEMATEVLPRLSMDELLNHMNHLLTD
jgi:signal transduction histidine kinase/DNA-binding response OmpR family regulator